MLAMAGFIGLSGTPKGIKNFKASVSGTQRFRQLMRRGPAGRGLKRTLKILIPYADTVKADETCQEPASVRVRRPIKIFP
jgi:hypothetical protein